ncbi:MAG: S-layer homology domain-containing protein [Evtepia sp.]|nr:S-layer homology domain-containing protein [Evtepia sp.]
MNFTDNAQMTVNENGQATFARVAVTGTTTEPLINVQSGGKLAGTVPDVGEIGSTISSVGTAIYVNSGGETTIDFSEVASSGNSAITVASGGTLTLATEDVKITTTAAGKEQAIDLEDGSTIKKGDTAITVGTDTSDDGTADNYVDNYGNIILAKGAKTSEDESNILNAAVILPNGTIIQGSPDEAPTLKTETGTDGKTTTTVTIPENGSVTEPGKDKQDLANGGTATSIPNNEGGTTTTVTPAEIKATSITLDKNTLTLYTNREAQKTGTLNATIMPENATNKAVTWTSSNENVATVTNGVVTAVANGTATITAKVGSDDSALSATCTVTVTTYSSGGPSTPSYSVTAPAVDNGKVTVSPKYAKKNSTVTLTVTPDEGYELSSLAVTDAKGNVLELTDKGNGKYTFKMPASKVDVTATFKEIPTTHVCPAEKYTDVDTTQWYHEGVDYVIANGMMNGTGTNIFEPNATTTRGMIVTILYRLEKEPAAGTSPFTDVDADQWYAKAVAWAAANGVVNGTSPTTFHPNDPITREQMAAILYRYASFKGYDVTQKADLAGFTDASQISGYAKDAMSWANQEGLIGGVSATTLQPQGSATRAQVATILMRFCENMTK